MLLEPQKQVFLLAPFHCDTPKQAKEKASEYASLKKGLRAFNASPENQGGMAKFLERLEIGKS